MFGICDFMTRTQKMGIQSSNISRFFFLLILTSLAIAVFSKAETKQYSTSTCNKQCLYTENIAQADCDRRSPEYIPIECNSAWYLYLRYNNITKIEPGTFEGFHSLRELIISDNNISNIDANTFTGAPKLSLINLRSNNIHRVDQCAFNGTENLQVINLDQNHLITIEEGTFQFTLKLEYIYLSSNHLSHLGRGVFRQLKNLKLLHLTMNKLTNLPENIFKDLSSLVELNLAKNLLFTIPSNLFTYLVSVKEIILYGNRLTAVNNSILNLPNIYAIDLRDNRLSKFESVSWENCTSRAEKLYLEGNPWACDCSLEAFRFFCFHVSHSLCNITDDPVCTSPPYFVNRTLKGLNQTLCTPPNMSRAPVSDHESQHVDTMTEARNEHSKESSQIMLLVLIPPIFLFIAMRMIVYRIGNYGLYYPSDIEELSVPEPSNKRPCERTPSKRQSQDPPAPPSKNSHYDEEGIQRDRCRRNLSNTFN